MDGQKNMIYFVALCFYVPSVRGLCDLPPVNSIKETDPSGTIILNVSKSIDNNATFRVVDTANPTFVQALSNRLLLKNYDTRLTLENTKPLDFEEFMIQYNRDITSVTLKITCNGIESDVLLRVEPENEFSPVFMNSPYNINISESTAVGTIIFKLKERVNDRDVGGVQNFIFRINPYNVGAFDGASFFSIPASSQGNISLIKALDFDNPTIRNPLRLNVSVADGQSNTSKTAYTVLTLNITDADDQAPYFNFPNCLKPCPAPPFEAITRLDYTGQLTISPNRITAKDDDTLGTSLIYSIQSGNKNNLFEINEKTGVVTQKTPVNALPDSKFRLVIEVRKDLTSVELSSIAILTIHVWERMSNESASLSVQSQDGLLIPVIILSTLLTIMLIVFVVVLVIYIRKHHS